MIKAAAAAVPGLLLGVGYQTGSAFGVEGTFTDQTSVAEIDAVHHPMPGMSYFLAGGAVGDFDRDGWQDIYFAGGGGTPDQLLINNGDGTFTDQAASWGIAVLHRSTAGVVGDYDGDGWLDLYVTSLGPASANAPGHHRLYRNNGDGTFVDVAEVAEVDTCSPNQADGWGGAWGDYDGDGDLDLAVAGWYINSGGNRLFRNNGNGTFSDVTTSVGLASLDIVDGFAPRFADMDSDFLPELIWIGDDGTSRYYVNDSDGTFTDFTSESNTSQSSTEMGATVADFDADGKFDFYVTTVLGNKLYLNQGGHQYVEASVGAGVWNGGWGWGTVAIDFDHDRRIDIAITTQDRRQYLFHNVTPPGGPLVFDEVAEAAGLVSSVSGRGLANFDYDNDGDQDLIIFPFSDSVRLFRNETSGSDANWLRVFLDPAGAEGIAPDGIGAVITVTIGTSTHVSRIDGGTNYLSQSELSAHFGLGPAAMVDQLNVLWPNGEITVLTDVPANQTITVNLAAGLPGDADGDGIVGVADMVTIIESWGPCHGCAADLNGDGVVNVTDLIEVIENWGS